MLLWEQCLDRNHEMCKAAVEVMIAVIMQDLSIVQEAIAKINFKNPKFVSMLKPTQKVSSLID